MGNRCDAAQVRGRPAPDLGYLTLGKSLDGRVSLAMDRNQQGAPNCPFLGPRQCLPAWRTMGADPVLLHCIERGVNAPMHRVPAPNQPRAPPPDPQLMATIGEYLEQGVVRRLTRGETKRTRAWIPIFAIPKKDSGAIRLITDMRALNACHDVQKHKAESWAQVQEVLNDPRWSWAITLDLKSWFHHLAMHPKMQRWMRFRVGGQGYQILGMPFGWSMSPYWAHRLARPVREWMHQQGWPHCWWVDDILLLGTTPEEVETRASLRVGKLTELGLQVNVQKSMTHAAQEVSYLGHYVNLATHRLRPDPAKNIHTLTMVRKAIKSNNFIPTHLASVAGNLLDAQRSNAALHGLPQQIMRAAARGVLANQQRYPRLSVQGAWRTSVQKPHSLRNALSQCREAVARPVPRPFRPGSEVKAIIRSDASDQGWGACLLINNKEVQTCAQPWSEQEHMLHITHREALASALAVQTMLQDIPKGCHLLLEVDAVSTAYCWRKGSKLPGMNKHIAPQLTALSANGVFTEARHIPGVTNKRADWLSRNIDPKNYQLKPELFLAACRHFGVYPEVDLFASRKNRQCQKYASWRADLKSLGNAFALNWGRFLSWINPPWELIPRVLKKIREDQAQALVCLPVWKAAPWWPQLQSLMTSTPVVLDKIPLYSNPEGKLLPPPRWGTLFTTVSGYRK